MQASFLITILVFFAFATDVWCRQHGHLDKTKHDLEIVGGYNDTVENNPHIVNLLLKDAKQDYYECGGSIISENYILTAAHCTEGIVEVTIRAGSAEANSGGDQYTGKSITQHPSYNPRNLDNDVAVIRTTRPIRLDGVKTKAIKLPKQDCDVKSGTNVKVSGWGRTKENDRRSSPHLMSVILPAFSKEACLQQFGYNVTKCQFCTVVPEGGKGPCMGDSGGPVVESTSARSKYSRSTGSAQTGKQLGIVSYGYGCARPGVPSVYTKVSCASVRTWIKLTTGV